MEEDNASSIRSHATLVCGKSWTAYIGTVILALLLFFGLLPAAFTWNELAAAGVLVASALLVGYRVLVIRSYQLYYDDVGVWLYSGILPWTKGVVGVKWRDMDEATFVQNFWSWLFKSYAIRIGHRFTKSSEIYLTSMARGKNAVVRLNARHQEMIRSHTIV
ncbi:MAG: hypothetical protein V4754_10055 [Pseudomonadota bacterium]